jgi:hypothetical protein
MAISILQSPQQLQPVYNPIILALDSTQKAQTNFTYIAEVIINGLTASTFNFTSNPDGYGVADIHKRIEPYLSSSINTSSLATFRRVEDSYTDYSVKLYEQYDVSGITTTFSGASYTATTYAYNGVIPTLDFINYDYTDYEIKKLIKIRVAEMYKQYKKQQKCPHEKWDGDTQIRTIECRECGKRAWIQDYRNLHTKF